MRTMPILISFACVVMALPLAAATPLPAAPQLHVYPAHDQSPVQQQKDEGECADWAIKSSGYDPAHPPAVAVAQPAPVTGSGARVRGAAVGATVGAVGGNDVGNAAVKGAVVGGVVRRNRNRAAASQANQSAAQQQQSSAASYMNARQACLEGRGYTVR
jgi:hypothetical protein